MKLQRSRSQRDTKPPKFSVQIEEPQPATTASRTPDNQSSNRKSIFQFGAPTPATKSNDPPKPANSRMSFSRPRTAEKNDISTEAVPFETLDFKTGADTYSFPTPSPRLPPTKGGFLAAQPSPMSGSSGQSSPAIGVALGSPGNFGSKPKYGRSFTAGQPQTTMSRPPLQQMSQSWQLPSVEPPERPQVKKTKSSWKTLGGLFKGKQQTRDPLAVGVSRSQAPPTPPKDGDSLLLGRVGVLESPEKSPAVISKPKAARLSSHNRTASRGMMRFEARAEADRAALIRAMGSNSRSNVSTTKAPPKLVLPPNPSPSQPKKSEDIFRTGAALPTPRTPRLDIDLPSMQFERYSVMFEKLLEPKQSLLERRQSKLIRLNSTKKPSETITPLNLHPQTTPNLPKRSLTSPHISSPAKPPPKDQTSTAGPAFHRPRPLARSCTAPPAASSPVAARFIHSATVPEPSADSSPASPPYSEPSLPPTPNSAFTTTTLGPIAVSPAPPLPLPPKEPAWTMMTSQAPLASNPSKRPVLSRNPDSGRTLRVKSPEDLERQMVQVSVARQVSVSKARRQVREAHDVKQPLRPRVVELGKNRKSTVVLIEGGD